MQNQHVSKPFRPEIWFLIFLFVHVAAWTIVPALIRLNLPLDSIEGTVWGHQLEWGYDKNPFMNGWLTALAVWLDGYSGWMMYLFCQLSVAASLTAVWCLGKKIMPPIYALAAVLLLEGIQYYNFHAIDFNDNTLELGLWAAAIYFFYQAVRHKTYSAWMLTAIFLGLGMMAKYYTLALIAALGLFLLRKENRGQLATLKPYLALSIFGLMMVPHAIWLTEHQYITITYMFERGTAQSSWINHFFFPAQFAWQQFEALLPALIIFGFLFLGKKPRTATPPLNISQFDRTFLFYAGFGPFLLTIVLSFVMGIKLRAGWGMPLMSFWTLLFMTWITPRLSATKIYALIAGTFIMMTAMLSVYSVSLIDSSDTSSANFPGKEISATLTKEWQAKYHTPVSYIAGSRWIAGNISFHSSEHPAVWMEWDSVKSSWIDVEDLKKKGAIFVWDVSAHESLPAEVAKAFPNLSTPVIMEFNWQRNTHDLPPIKLGVAFLPPAN